MPQEGWEGWESLPKGQKGLGSPPIGLGGVRRPYQRAGVGWRAERDWASLLKGWEGLVGVLRPSWRYGRGRESFLESQEVL